jgi:S1-C subfamily serine protease
VGTNARPRLESTTFPPFARLALAYAIGVAGDVFVTVSLADGTDLDATVIGEDPTTDIAVLRVERRNLAVVSVGKSTDLMVGEWVVALGNPYTYLLGNSEPTVTAGVVSATGRNILPSRQAPGLYLDMIQTDARSIRQFGRPTGERARQRHRRQLLDLHPERRIDRAPGSRSPSSGRSGGGGNHQSGAVRPGLTGLDRGGASNMREWKSSGGGTGGERAPGGPAARADIREGAILVGANGRTLRNFPTGRP